LTTLRQALAAYLKEPRRAQTNEQYKRVLTPLVTAIGAERSLDLVSYLDLLDYFDQRGPGWAESTVYSYVTVVKAFFAWCVDVDLLERSPAQHLKRKTPRPDPTVNRAVPPDVLAKMVAAVRFKPRNRALLLFLIDSGCRIGGAASLVLGKLSLEKGIAELTEKGGVKFTARFGPDTADALAAWLKKRPAVTHEFVWTGNGPRYAPLLPDSISAIVRRLCAEIESDDVYSAHAIRHAVGHAYANAGIPPTITQRKLGHSDVTITLRYYYPQDEAAVDAVSRRYPLIALRGEPDEGAPKIVEIARRSG
jgi:integrase